MDVTIREEAGYDLALYGFSLSYKDRAVKPEDWWCFDPRWFGMQGELDDRRVRTTRTALANSGRGKGHDKFLRQIMVWVDIEAPRYWWSEMDTYKVGTVAQSESTMHTLSKRDLTLDDIGACVQPEYLDCINEYRFDMSVQELKAMLPEGYLQRRLVTMNYAVLRTIIEQRKNHRLPEWHTFIDSIYDQVAHPELLPKRG